MAPFMTGFAEFIIGTGQRPGPGGSTHPTYL